MRGMFYVVLVGGAALVALIVAAVAVWAVGRVLRARRRRRDELARQGARWEVYLEPRGGGLDYVTTEVGLVRVAQTSAGREELERVTHSSLPEDAPEFEVAIETDRARGRATVLNDALDAAEDLTRRHARRVRARA